MIGFGKEAVDGGLEIDNAFEDAALVPLPRGRLGVATNDLTRPTDATIKRLFARSGLILGFPARGVRKFQFECKRMTASIAIGRKRCETSC